jgi:hypothetical protein
MLQSWRGGPIPGRQVEFAYVAARTVDSRCNAFLLSSRANGVLPAGKSSSAPRLLSRGGGFLRYGLDHPDPDYHYVEQEHLSALWREGMDTEAKEYAEQLSKEYAVKLSEAWSAAALAVPAWLVYWPSVIAISRAARGASANHPVAARALTEVAAFAAMIGVAMLVTYLFPERHFWHGKVSHDATYSPVVFAATLISEVGMYISWRVLGAVTQANKPGPCPAPVIGLPREDKPADVSPAREPPADVQEEGPPNLPTPDSSSRPLDQIELVTPWARRRLPSMGTMAFIAAVLLIAAYLLMAAGIPASELPQAAAFVVALIWLLVWATATVFTPRAVSKPKYALAVLIVLTMAISIAAQGYRRNAEEKAARTQPTTGLRRVPATVDQKPPAECATAKNVEECADTLQKLGKNFFDAVDYVYGAPASPPRGRNR